MQNVIFVIAGIAYPVAVYVGRDAVPPMAFVTVGCALLAGHLANLEANLASVWRAPLLAAGAGLVALAALDSSLGAKAYPVAVSLAAATAFAVSLIRPPSLIERFARRTEPDLSTAGQVYCRRVTMLWVLWLILNALIALGLALRGSDTAWALWTGLISYAAMGLMLGGEWLLRSQFRKRMEGR